MRSLAFLLLGGVLAAGCRTGKSDPIPAISEHHPANPKAPESVPPMAPDAVELKPGEVAAPSTQPASPASQPAAPAPDHSEHHDHPGGGTP